MKGCWRASSAVILVVGVKSRHLYNKLNAESGIFSQDGCTSVLSWEREFVLGKEPAHLSVLLWDASLAGAFAPLLGYFLLGGLGPDDECLWSFGFDSPLQSRIFFTGLGSKSLSGDCLEWWFRGALSLIQSSFKLMGGTSGTHTSSLPEPIRSNIQI